MRPSLMILFVTGKFYLTLYSISALRVIPTEICSILLIDSPFLSTRMGCPWEQFREFQFVAAHQCLGQEHLDHHQHANTYKKLQPQWELRFPPSENITSASTTAPSCTGVKEGHTGSWNFLPCQMATRPLPPLHGACGDHKCCLSPFFRWSNTTGRQLKQKG